MINLVPPNHRARSCAHRCRTGTGLAIEMPITEAVCAMLDGKLSAAAAVDALMRRDPKVEVS